MRTRYSAHVVGDTDYLDRTYLPTAKGTDSVGHELGKRKWVKLEIHQHDMQVIIKHGISTHINRKDPREFFESILNPLLAMPTPLPTKKRLPHTPRNAVVKGRH